MKPYKDLTGTTVGVFTITGLAGRSSDGHSMWFARCPACGGTVSSRQTNMRKTKSCGCMTRSLISKSRTKHGLKDTPEYYTWRNMIKRCCDPRDKAFKYYGGRGIRVCNRWLHDVTLFVADMGCRPSPHHQIDRIDVNGNYEPQNCRWATASENARNRRKRAA